jgi:hypothetical protein
MGRERKGEMGSPAGEVLRRGTRRRLSTAVLQWSVTAVKQWDEVRTWAASSYV